jgi:hypothetical protein
MPRFEEAPIIKPAKFEQAPIITPAEGVVTEPPSTEFLKVREEFPVSGRAAAAVQAFAPTATLGLTDILAPRIAAIGKKTLPETKKELEEKQELLKKAFPTISSIADIGAFVTPGAPARGVVRGAERLAAKAPAKIPGAVRRAAGTGAGFGAVTGIEEAVGAPTEEVSLRRGLEAGIPTAIATAPIALGLGAAGGALTQGLQNLGKRIQTSIIKPKKIKAHKGFVPQNVFKHKLNGDLDQTLEKSNIALDRLSTQLDKKLAENPEIRLNVIDVLGKVEEKLAKEIQQGKHIGKQQEIRNAVNKFTNDIIENAPDGAVDLLQANTIKRAVGDISALNAINPTAEITASKAVANEFYFGLKEAIEKAAPQGIRDINKQMSEIIPIRSAVIDRVPIDGRNEFFSLKTMLALGGGGGLIFAGQRQDSDLLTALGIATAGGRFISQSPRAATAFFRAGERLARVPPTLTDILRTGILRKGGPGLVETVRPTPKLEAQRR